MMYFVFGTRFALSGEIGIVVVDVVVCVCACDVDPSLFISS